MFKRNNLLKILILGADGQLGNCLRDQLAYSSYATIFAGRSDIDISDLPKVEKKIIEIAPDVVINASAFVAVDKAEEEQELADLVNNTSVNNLALICAKNSCVLIHVSTDYVFDGTANSPYDENALTNPLGVYGRSKRNGEIAIEMSGCDFVIIRTAWIFSEYGNNFLKTMIRLGASQEMLRIVSDQFGSPTYGQDIARGILLVLHKIDARNCEFGLYHLCGLENVSWYDFAVLIFQRAEYYGFKCPRDLLAIGTMDYPTLAERPRYSVLNSARFLSSFGIKQASLRNNVDVALKSLLKQ